MRARRLVGNGYHDHHVGIVTVCDEGLCPIQHVTIAFADRRRACAACIRSRSWLGQPPCPDELRVGQSRDVFPLLFFGSSEIDVIGAEGVMGSHDDPDRAVNSRKLLNGNHIVHIAKIRTTVLRWEDHSHQPHLAEVFNYPHGEL